jgi:hypothetical protein
MRDAMLDVVVDKGLLTRREYDQLVGRGVFEGAPVELLRAQIGVMSPQGEMACDAHRVVGAPASSLVG